MIRGAPARIDAHWSARVNHEIYYFSTPSAVQRFREDPLKWCGSVTDPVSLERFRPDERSPHATWNDRPYFFRSDSTRTVFLESPEEYAEPKAVMIPVPEGDSGDPGSVGAEPSGPKPGSVEGH